MTNASEYKAGLAAGTNDTAPMTDFEMSTDSEAFALGYTVGHSYTVSVLHASPIAAAMTAGELAKAYNLDLDLVCDKMNFNAEERRTAQSSYRNSYGDDDDIDD